LICQKQIVQQAVLPIFIFDRNILEKLPEDDARVTFIHNTLQKIRKQLQDTFNSSLAILHGQSIEVYKQLLENYDVKDVYTNHDYEPYAIKRDADIEAFLSQKNRKKRRHSICGLHAIYEAVESTIQNYSTKN